jgi:hypothetical protein
MSAGGFVISRSYFGMWASISDRMMFIASSRMNPAVGPAYAVHERDLRRGVLADLLPVTHGSPDTIASHRRRMLMPG